MRDWSSDVCSSDLGLDADPEAEAPPGPSGADPPGGGTTHSSTTCRGAGSAGYPGAAGKSDASARRRDRDRSENDGDSGDERGPEIRFWKHAASGAAGLSGRLIRFFGYLRSELVAKRGILAIVADGMGGLKNGKSISERAIGKFRKAFLNFSPAGNIPRQLSSLVAETNHDIYETDRQKGGTTLICVYIYRNGMHWVSVGDSAIFLFRQGRLYQLNKEHNRLNELYLKFMYREITKEQLMAEPSLQGLTSNIGRRELRDLDQNLTGLRLQSGDRILLCTDGVSGRLTEKELLVAMSQGTAQACADAMKSMVLKKNAPKQDNLTAEVICCD